MIKLLTIVGARPQFIKAAALSRTIRQEFSDRVSEILVHTGQHYDDSMSAVFFREMQIPEPDYHLGIGSASHGAQTGLMLQEIEKVILKEKPHGVVLYGDTNSTLAGALAAIKVHVPVIHIEAGLRSFNKTMPEEVNRITCDHASTLLFSPTVTGVENLRKEGILHHESGRLSADRQGVFHCGDVMYDNCLFFKKVATQHSEILQELGLENKPFVLATIHRPSNTDDPEKLKGILSSLSNVAAEHSIHVVLPLHPRTRTVLNSNREIEKAVRNPEWMKYTEAVSFLDMMHLEASSRLIFTDSGGVQKEAWFMEKPVVVLREETEWVEIVEAGNGILAGPDPKRIVQAAAQFLQSPPGSFPPLFGDGRAAAAILDSVTSRQWF